MSSKLQLMNHTLTSQMRGKLERNLNNVKRKLQMGGRRTHKKHHGRTKRSKRSNRTRRHRSSPIKKN